MIAGSQTIADDRRRSQTIAEDRTWFYLLRSSAITIAGSQAIAEVCFHMIADDRRTFCDPRSSAIIWKPAFNLGDKIRQNLVLYFLDEIFNCAPSLSGEGQTAQGLRKPAGSENTEGSRSRSQSLLKGELFTG